MLKHVHLICPVKNSDDQHYANQNKETDLLQYAESTFTSLYLHNHRYTHTLCLTPLY